MRIVRTGGWADAEAQTSATAMPAAADVRLLILSFRLPYRNAVRIVCAPARFTPRNLEHPGKTTSTRLFARLNAPKIMNRLAGRVEGRISRNTAPLKPVENSRATISRAPKSGRLCPNTRPMISPNRPHRAPENFCQEIRPWHGSLWLDFRGPLFPTPFSPPL
jgi:hypothetical protein